jgi:phosphoribosylformylglycinamidine (FGAM) synthase-like amidotransferase family enzyme
MLVTQNDIRTIKKVVKQLQVAMSQQCLSMGVCIGMCMFTEEDYTTCQHSMSFVLNAPMQYFSVFSAFLIFLWPLVVHHQHYFNVPENVCSHLSGR